MISRIIFTALLLLAVDLYFFQSIRTVFQDAGNSKPLITIAYWSISLLSIAALALFIIYPEFTSSKFTRYYLASVVLILFASKLIGSLFLLIDDLRRGTSWLIANFSSDGVTDLSRKKFLSQASIVLAAIPFSTLIYGMIKGAFNYTVRRVTLNLDNLPDSFDGMKVLQISDMHTGSFAFTTPLERAVDLIKKEAADLIFFTGDLVNSKTEEAEKFRDILKEVKAPRGVYSILGNHDYGDYVQWESEEEKTANHNYMKQFHKEIGWNLLLNENRILKEGNDELAIIGVENWGASRHFPKYGDLDKAKKGVENTPVKLLLSHDPSHWDAQVRKDHQDIDVTFSGHTHGFQFGIEIPGFIKWSPVQYAYKQWAGLYEKGKQKLYVNRGIGFLGYLGRVGISPEITVFELRQSKKA